MIVTVCALVASVGSAIFVSHKIASPKAERVVTTPVDRVTLAKEYNRLAEYLIKELSRIQTSGKSDPADIDLITKSLEKIFQNTWRGESFYSKEVETFLNVLRASRSLERDSPSPAYLSTLKEIIEYLVPECAEAVLRGETGNVTTFSYNFMNSLEVRTSQLARNNQKKLISGSTLKAGN
jgi:hypothetical protein